MIDRTTAGARGAWPPRASRPILAPKIKIRAWIERELAARGRTVDRIPVLGTPEWESADDVIKLYALMTFALGHYEGDADREQRLRIDAENDRAVYLARFHEAVDQANDAIRADRQALAKIPLLSELQARRREVPPPRPMIQAPGWPAPVIPGSGGRRLGEPNGSAA